MKLQFIKLHLITYGLGNAFEPGKFMPVKNRGFVKPDGGLWASPSKTKWGWKHWCKAEEFGNLENHFTFHYQGNTFRIDSLPDALEMPWISVYDIMEFPDFEAMARMGIDAIWLTERGERETRFTHPRSLYGWDCECVLIMNPAGIQVDSL